MKIMYNVKTEKFSNFEKRLIKTSVIPDTTSMAHLKTLANHFNIKYCNLLDLASFRTKMQRPIEFRKDYGQLQTSIDRQFIIFQLILDNAHPAPGQNSSIVYECVKEKNLAMKLFLR